MEWLHSPCAGGKLEGCGALKGVLVPLAAAQRRLRAACPAGTGTGAAAQRDCKQSGPGWTARLLLLCFHYSTGQKVILLTICAKFSGKLPRAAEQ